MRAGPPWRPCGKRMLSRNSLTTLHRDRRSATAVTRALSSSANGRATPLPWHSLSGWMQHRPSRKKRQKKRRRNEKRLNRAQNKKNPRWNQKSPLSKKRNRHRHRQKKRSQKRENGSAENRRSRKNNLPWRPDLPGALCDSARPSPPQADLCRFFESADVGLALHLMTPDPYVFIVIFVGVA